MKILSAFFLSCLLMGAQVSPSRRSETSRQKRPELLNHSWTVILRGGDSRYAVGLAMYMTKFEMQQSGLRFTQIQPRVPPPFLPILPPSYVPSPIVSKPGLHFFVLIQESAAFDHPSASSSKTVHPYFDLADIESLVPNSVRKIAFLTNAEMWSDARSATREAYSTYPPKPHIYQLRLDAEKTEPVQAANVIPAALSSLKEAAVVQWQADLAKTISEHAVNWGSVTFRGGSYRFTVGPFLYMTKAQIEQSKINLVQIFPTGFPERDPSDVPVAIVAERDRLYLVLPYEPFNDDPSINLLEKKLDRDLSARHPYVDLADVESIMVLAQGCDPTVFKNAEMWRDGQLMSHATAPSTIIPRLTVASTNQKKSTAPGWWSSVQSRANDSGSTGTQSITTYDMIASPNGPMLVPHTITAPKQQE